MGLWDAIKSDLASSARRVKREYDRSDFKRGLERATDAVKEKVASEISSFKSGLQGPGYYLLKNVMLNSASDLTRKILPNVSDHFYNRAIENGKRFDSHGAEQTTKDILELSDAEVCDLMIVLMIEKNQNVDSIFECIESQAPERAQKIARMVEAKIAHK